MSEPSRRKLLTDYGHGYGLGIAVGGTRIGHDGRTAGASAALDWYPKGDHVVVVLSNVQSGAMDQVRSALGALARGRRPEPLRPRGVSSEARLRAAPGWLTGSLRQRLVGSYRFAPDLSIRIESEGHGLTAAANGGFATELVAMEEGVLFSRALYANVAYSQTESEAVDELIWLGGESPWTGKRENR